MPTIFEIWDVTREELSEAILNNGSLRGMVFGCVAEIKLRKLLASHADVSSHVKDDDHDRSKKGDLRVIYKSHEFRIESESLQTARNKTLADGTFAGFSQVDASDRRTVTLPDDSQLQTTNLLVGEFDILSVNCFTFCNQWNFAFARNRDLPRSTYRNYSETQREHLLATTVKLVWPPTGIFTDDIFALMDAIIEERESTTEIAEPVIVQEKGKMPEIIE